MVLREELSSGLASVSGEIATLESSFTDRMDELEGKIESGGNAGSGEEAQKLLNFRKETRASQCGS